MKKCLFLWMTLLLIVLYPAPALAYEVPQKIRVGLESQFAERGSIAIANTVLQIGYEINGQFIPLSYISGDGFTVQPLQSACVQTPGAYDQYEQAWAAATAYGAQYVPALSADGLWTVYRTGVNSDAAATDGALLPSSTARIQLLSNGKPIAIFDNEHACVQFSAPQDGVMRLGESGYRGVIEFGRYAGNNITAVNVLSPDEYLYSVVPSEMPPSFQAEALKAQAVAARSYMLTRMGVHLNQHYDLCDLSHCQHYAGVSRENDASTLAVIATGGRVAYYDGQPINAVYFSSSGGATDHAENVWINAVPYLKSVVEINEYEPKLWTRVFTLNELSSLLAAYQPALGTATGAAITRMDANGRVQELTIYGTLGNAALTKEEIRTFFSPSVGGTLESRLFTIANGAPQFSETAVTVTDGVQTQTRPLQSLSGVSELGAVYALNHISAYDGINTVNYGSSAVVSDGERLVLSGRGWGHGVGMSQRGAEGMAQLGFDYISILNHYYTGIVIE